MEVPFQKVNKVLPETVIGSIKSKSRLITLNEMYSRSKAAKYYIGLLEDAARKGYDCMLKLDGTDVIRKLSKAI